MERVDRAVLAALAEDVLRPAVIMAVVDGVLAALVADAEPSRIDAHKREIVGVSGDRSVDRGYRPGRAADLSTRGA